MAGATRDTAPLKDDYQRLERKLAAKLSKVPNTGPGETRGAGYTPGAHKDRAASRVTPIKANRTTPAGAGGAVGQRNALDMTLPQKSSPRGLAAKGAKKVRVKKMYQYGPPGVTPSQQRGAR